MLARRLRLWAWAFLTPALLVYTVFWVFALGAGLGLGTTKWTGYGTMRYVGLHNVLAVLQDPQFYAILGRNLQYGLFHVTIGLGLSLGTAILMDRCTRGRLFFRTTIYLPMVLSWIVVTFLIRWGLNPSFGIPKLLESLGLGFLKPNWFLDLRSQFYVIVVVALWKHYPFGMLAIYAGLQNISLELKEAAYIDGADELRCVWYVVLPLLKPIMAVVISLSLMDAFRVFEPFYVMVGTKSGTGYLDLDVLSTTLYRRAFVHLTLGDASALGIVLFVLTLSVSVFYLRTLGRTEE
ncbi:MAG: sugar ABC transporter permease [Anaerolineae bacterium]|nr:sugar ABC transporter permease [Anaerolineae bacterium]